MCVPVFGRARKSKGNNILITVDLSEEGYQRFYTAGLEDEGRKPEAKECM